MSKLSVDWFVCALFLLLCCGPAATALAPHAEAQCNTLPPRDPVQLNNIAIHNYSGGNDCWGWISPAGIEYAIMGGRNEVAFVNLNTGQQDDFVPLTSCIWRDMKTLGHYCYAVSECGSDGVTIIDMQFLPDSVHVVGKLLQGGGTSHNISIDTSRAFAYVVRANYSGFRAIDLANPEAPVEVNWVGTADIHDMYARNDTVWVAEGNGHRFSIWDMADKQSPVKIAQVGLPASGYVHNIWPSRDGRFVVTTEETGGKTVKIWDTVDPLNIFLIGEYLAPSQLAHNAHMEGNYLFLSHYESGVAVVDLTYPECPVEVARFDTYTTSENSNFNGCWGVYPHAGTGHVYASNVDGRLFIFETDIVTADFAGTPQVGTAPLTVDFTDMTASTVTSWLWDFGDGMTSTLAAPSHTYQPGVYSVTLEATTSTGTGKITAVDYVTALAETLWVANIQHEADQAVVWDVNLTNNLPISEFTLPIHLTNIPAEATLDSASHVGTRTDHFESAMTQFYNAAGGQIVIHYTADADGGPSGGSIPPLPAGSGPITRLYLTIPSDATPGTVIQLDNDPIISFSADFASASITFAPVGADGTLTILPPPCDCACHGDPQCDGLTDVLDVLSAINVAFRDEPLAIDQGCPHSGRTDTDCDGVTDVLDVVNIVGVAFRNVDKSVVVCSPCAF